jgi:hypothetical protein
MNPHNLSRVRSALLAAVALLSAAAPAEAQLVPCAGIQGTGYKILLDDIFDAAGGTASPLMSSLVFKLTTNLEQLQLESGLPLKVIRCAKRRPSDPADFKRPMVEQLNARQVVLEVWGTTAQATDTAGSPVHEPRLDICSCRCVSTNSRKASRPARFSRRSRPSL